MGAALSALSNATAGGQFTPTVGGAGGMGVPTAPADGFSPLSNALQTVANPLNRAKDNRDTFMQAQKLLSSQLAPPQAQAPIFPQAGPTMGISPINIASLIKWPNEG